MMSELEARRAERLGLCRLLLAARDEVAYAGLAVGRCPNGEWVDRRIAQLVEATVEYDAVVAEFKAQTKLIERAA